MEVMDALQKKEKPSINESFQWRGRDLNPHPRAYESPAPPLSYLAMSEAPGILLWVRYFVNFKIDRRSFCE